MGRYCLEGEDTVREVSTITRVCNTRCPDFPISLDYLFQLAVEMHKLGLDPAGPIAPIEQ